MSEKRANIAPQFIAELAQCLALPIENGLPQGVSPEAIFGYIYAVLHGPQYRARFASFLKTDFPRVPLPVSLAHFAQLAALGTELVALHTLDAKSAPVLKEKRHALSGGDDLARVEKPRFDAATRRVWLNDTQSFSDVDEAVYNFKIGGYTVAEKWLADRRGRILNFDERRLYPQILIALAQTRVVMAQFEVLEEWDAQAASHEQSGT